MGANFYREDIAKNTWQPEVLGVDFSEKLARKLAEIAAEGTEIWTAWAELEADGEHPTMVQQVTQDNCHLISSLLDDDADAVLLYDPRDEMWFRFNRLNHPDIFNWVAQTVGPWALRIGSIVPLPHHYKTVIDQLTSDVPELEHIPDGWLDEPGDSGVE